MSTVTYDQFLPEVTPFLPDVPEFVATNAVRNACIEFCEKTRYLQMDGVTFSTVIGQNSYNIASLAGLTADQIFVDVMETWCNGSLVIPKTPEELSRIFQLVDWRSQQGHPIYLTRISQPNILLVPVPQDVSTVNMRIAVGPSRASQTVDSEIWEHFIEHISFGARARLYGMAGQPFYNAAAAQDYEVKFKHAILEVRQKINKGLTRASVAAEFQRFV